MRKNYSLSAALALSLFIYLFYRTDKTAVNQLIIYLLSLESYIQLKNMVASALPLDDLIVYSLPGGLWVFCATALAHGFYFEFRHYKILIAPIPALFAIGLEFCQCMHFTHGTFDLWDITFYAIGWLLATRLFYTGMSKHNILSPLTLHGFMCLSCIFIVFLAHVSR
jgi:hypothetical protein